MNIGYTVYGISIYRLDGMFDLAIDECNGESMEHVLVIM